MNRMLLNFRLFSRILYSIVVLVIIIVGGTLGYVYFENWSILDSFYQTIITVSTVGFGEVDELSNAGKLFTAFLIITSFGTFAYARCRNTCLLCKVIHNPSIPKPRC